MIGDFSPCQYLAKAEGLQLAKASFRWKPRYNLTLAQQHRFMGLHALLLLFLLDHITSVSTAYRMDTRIRTNEFYFAAPPVLLCSLAFCSHFGTRLFLIVSSWSESQAVLWGARQADLLCILSSVLVRSFTQRSHLCQLLCKTLWMPATVTLGHSSLTCSLGEDRKKSMSARFPMDAVSGFFGGGC